MGTWEWDPLQEKAIWSPRLEELYGLRPGGFDGQISTFRELVHQEDRERVSQEFKESFASGTDSAMEYRAALPRPDASVRWLFSRGQVVLDADGRVVRGIGTVLDITERKLAQQALEHQAFHDALTGLPNRALFTRRLEHALARADRLGTSVAVLFLDLEDVRGEADAITVAERIGRALAVPVLLRGRAVVVSASIGVALALTGGDSQDLLHEADLAMYRAKADGRVRCALFNPDPGGVAALLS